MLFQATAGLLPLFSAAIGQVNVRPAGKEVLLVPNAFPVSQENHLSEVGISACPSFVCLPASVCCAAEHVFMPLRRCGSPNLVNPPALPRASRGRPFAPPRYLPGSVSCPNTSCGRRHCNSLPHVPRCGNPCRRSTASSGGSRPVEILDGCSGIAAMVVNNHVTADYRG